ncbi:receptor-type tyrosine-protein phosphatase F-like [Xenia sp. Carnegie-2017]|uniref:receptor-type tyrosine-protein phosphatase F-like n=1 Tax=Xenia sp. Carnegie-2017 TaxID=2897299 RepID=UPI001F04BEE3|nr:receptor-type tyrosine-protein phosphatase F-like [Xenia sp. Carnegie-2017]
MKYMIEEQRLDINNVKPGTKYYVRVLASTIVGSGCYSNVTWVFTNGLAPELSTKQIGNTLTYLLQNPNLEYRYFYVVAMKNVTEESRLPSNFKNTDLVTYSKAISSTQPMPYIAAVVSRRDFKPNFTLGDGETTTRRSNGENYYNGPLKPGTSYKIFQRVFINDQGDYYSTDWSPVAATAQKHKSSVPEGPPLNVQIVALSSSSLSVTWDPPDKKKTNGKIVNYTVCITHLENETCSMKYMIEEQRLDINNVKPGTKYYVRVLASTIVGSGCYSNITWVFTNGLAPELSTKQIGNTLTYLLQNPNLEYRYFYVVAIKNITEESRLPFNFKNTDLVTYSKAISSTQPMPYIPAVVFRRDFKPNFTLGDGETTTRRSNGENYYNGPLKPGTSYKIFQRVFINDQGDYYSTDWSPVAATAQKHKSSVPEGPPLNVQIVALSSSSLSVTWEPPDKNKTNGKIVNYTVCITHFENETCSMKYMIEEQHLDINNVKPGTKYYVRVLASTIVGSGCYSNVTWVFTNGLAPELSTKQIGNTLTYLLQNPNVEYR